MTCPRFQRDGEMVERFGVIGILREWNVHPLLVAARDLKKMMLVYVYGRKKILTPPETKKTVKSQNFDFS